MRQGDLHIATAVGDALPALCREYGFRNLTRAQLCRRAAITEADFARNYADLEDAYVSLYEELAERFIDRMAAAFDAELSWREQIRAVAHTFLSYLQEDPDRAHFTVVEPYSAGERAQIVRDSVFSALFALIDQGRNEPGAPPELTSATAEAIGGAIFLRVRTAIEREGTESLQDLVPELMHATVLPYLGPAAAAAELQISAPTSCR